MVWWDLPKCSRVRSLAILFVMLLQDEIYKLVENDIYPRFLKSNEYKNLIKSAKEAKAAGKGFFAKLQKKSVYGGVQDATESSPCLPNRFARSQVLYTATCQ